jgi:hypothetical protein
MAVLEKCRHFYYLLFCLITIILAKALAWGGVSGSRNLRAFKTKFDLGVI